MHIHHKSSGIAVGDGVGLGTVILWDIFVKVYLMLSFLSHYYTSKSKTTLWYSTGILRCVFSTNTVLCFVTAVNAMYSSASPSQICPIKLLCLTRPHPQQQCQNSYDVCAFSNWKDP
ncbi:hypothetical protein GDO86_004387 [Hymenochirus boettgeri]|uniref:Uncharacterized protein n=1 Tax=Hymenochirus boettgeri TaxID=247094 RepID=A0A8T2KAD5_9PIPI|nr:hypothetical protein GDO86_004387 [Hymenochirus boettgeri]